MCVCVVGVAVDDVCLLLAASVCVCCGLVCVHIVGRRVDLLLSLVLRSCPLRHVHVYVVER